MYSVKLHLGNGRANERTEGRVRTSVCPFACSCVRLSLCPLYLSGTSILWGNEPRCFI